MSITPQSSDASSIAKSTAAFHLGFALLVLTLLSCGGRDQRPNVLIVTFDTTRADHIGCYGDELASTPTVDALAREGVLFEQAMSAVPITLPSHSTLMTGKVPFVHGVRDNGLFVLGEEQETLAELLAADGYRTAAAVGSYPLLRKFGIGQGFEFFDDHITGDYEDLYGDRVFPKDRLFFDERPAGQVNEAILPWLEEHYQEPFFLWLHYFDPHLPLEPPAPYGQTFSHDLYRGEIAYADESLGAVMQRLRDLAVDDNTLVILTADHGEGHGEHRETTHSMLLYQGTLHVPLVMRLPGGVTGRRVKQRVGLVDVVPTVLDILGITIPEGLQGRSLAPYLKSTQMPEPDPKRELYAETLSPRLSRDWGELRALVANDMKYVHGPLRELYDLQSDPRELDNLVDRSSELASDLESRLALYLHDHSVEDLDASVTVDEETAVRLQALGYLQASGDAVGVIEERLRRDGDPPQRHIDNIAKYSVAKGLLFEGKILAGKEQILELLERDPGNPHYLEMLLQTEMRLGRSAAALAILDQLEKADAPFPPRALRLENAGLLLLRQNELTEALAKFEQAQELEPSAERAYRLSTIYAALGQPGKQKQQLERALQLEPNLVPARIDLGIALAGAGETDAAADHFRAAVNLHPYDERAHYNLGTFLVQEGHGEESIRSFERAVQLRPGYLAAHYALFEQNTQLGNFEAATASFETLHELAPASPEAHRARQWMGLEP